MARGIVALMVAIRNPQRAFLKRLVIVDIFFFIVGLYSFLTFDINSFDGMLVMISLLVILTSLFFFPSTLRNIAAIDNAKHALLAHWHYTPKEWSRYLHHEKRYRFVQGKLLAYVLSGITALVFIPFILVIPDGKGAMFLVLLALVGFYFFMGLVFPKIVSHLRKNQTREALLLKKGVLVGNEFHTWDFPLSRFNNAIFLAEPYAHVAITYDFVDRTGPRSYTVNVPVPARVKSVERILSRFS